MEDIHRGLHTKNVQSRVVSVSRNDPDIVPILNQNLVEKCVQMECYILKHVLVENQLVRVSLTKFFNRLQIIEISLT